MKRLLSGLLVAWLTFTFSLVLVRFKARPQLAQVERETVLKQSLQAMRKAIDHYAADREQLPQSLNDLAEQGYIREVPIDPMTGRRDWKTDME